MDDRKRILVSAAIVCVVLLAVLSSFLPNFFSRPPEVIVADPNATASPPPASGKPSDPEGVVVAVTPETVQRVIAGLERYESYSRAMAVEYFDDAGQSLGVTNIQVWADGGWLRSSAALPSGAVENAIAGEGSLWLWYGEEDLLYTGPAERIPGDLLQRIPTYEDVLEMDRDRITAADYVERDGVPCVYVEAEGGRPGYTERYWISETGGLLMAAETEKNGVVVYSMASGEVVSPMEQSAAAFTLPDGTVLYSPPAAASA